MSLKIYRRLAAEPESENIILTTLAEGVSNYLAEGLNPETNYIFTFERIVSGKSYTNVELAASTIAAGADNTPPALTFSPTDGSQNINTTSAITITASEGMRHTDGTTIDNSNVASLITLYYPQLLEDIPFTATINGTKTVITITPTTALNYSRTVEVTFAPVEDALGNETAAQTISFTTASSVFNPASVPGMKVLLYPEAINEADGTEILQWEDSSGENNHALSLTSKAPTAQTVNGVKVARFNGTSAYMDIDNVFVGGVDVESSMFIVVKPDHTTGTTIRAMFSTHNHAMNSSENASYLTTRENKEVWFHGQNHAPLQLFAGHYANTFETYIVNKKTGGVIDIWRNSVKIAEDISMAGLNLGQLLTLGALRTSIAPAGLNFFKGDIMAFGAYTKMLTRQEIDYLFTGLSSRYNIELENAYEPMYVSTNGLLNAFEMPSVRFTTGDINNRMDKIYPLNRGLGADRQAHYLGIYNTNLAPRLGITNGIKVIKLNGIDEALRTNQTYGYNDVADLPFTICYAGKLDSAGTDQLLWGLQGGSGSSNNVGMLGKSATNDTYVARRVSTIRDYKTIAPQNAGFHIVVAVGKGTTMDVYVDSVKVATDLTISTGVIPASAQRMVLGMHTGGGNQRAQGEFIAGYVYNRALSQSEVLELTQSINNRLELY